MIGDISRKAHGVEDDMIEAIQEDELVCLIAEFQERALSDVTDMGSA